uniref:vacuolar protein sorting-associated protein 37B-like n=1 Tax=Scatophagus argus TaxID=75038 RepID=UPI001ED82759|nr:vacuolar protein sorting-associated protein 37B-like [Scatophagus argus]
MSLPVQFGALRTRELRELLEDEDKINHIISCSEKFQQMHGAAERILVSNQKLAKVGLSQKPTFRDAKLLLAMKYKELEKLRSLIQAKHEKLADKHRLPHAQWCLLNKISHAEEECELLFQRFAEGKTPLADFLDSFLSTRKLQHISLVLVKKLQETTELKPAQSLRETHADAQHNACLPLCGLTSAVVLPACCHTPVLLPFATHANSGSCLQYLPFCPDYSQHLRVGVHGRGPRWPARPTRLEPLKMQQRKHQEAPH